MYGDEHWDHPAVTTAHGFACFLAFGGGRDIERLPTLVAVRGACLHAMRQARTSAHAAHDDAADTARRAIEADNVDTVLGWLPPLPVCHDTNGWTPEAVLSTAIRSMCCHIATDWCCATGEYSVSPDHCGIRTQRPTSEEQFRDLWGAVCQPNRPHRITRRRELEFVALLTAKQRT